jgi:hypothetical protein
MVCKLKRPLTEWKKIFASYTSEKGLITRIYRELKKLNSLKINEPIKKWATEMNRTYSKEEVQVAKKYMKECSPSPGDGKGDGKGNANQNHTKILPHICWNSYHQEHHQQQMLVRMRGEKEALYIAGGNVN